MQETIYCEQDVARIQVRNIFSNKYFDGKKPKLIRNQKFGLK